MAAVLGTCSVQQMIQFMSSLRKTSPAFKNGYVFRREKCKGGPRWNSCIWQMLRASIRTIQKLCSVFLWCFYLGTFTIRKVTCIYSATVGITLCAFWNRGEKKFVKLIRGADKGANPNPFFITLAYLIFLWCIWDEGEGNLPISFNKKKLAHYLMPGSNLLINERRLKLIFVRLKKELFLLDYQKKLKFYFLNMKVST